MPDPFEELRELGAGMPARPLPASEVRRRGDRMRRRRTAFQAAGAAMVVAVLGSGGLLAGENTSGTGPPPGPASQAPSPTASATEPPDAEELPDRPSGEPATVTRIPDGFDLALGIPPDDAESERTTDTRLNTGFAFDPCHDEGSTGPARTDFRQVVQTVPAGAYVHQLAVYPDARAADEAMAELAQDLADCPTYAYPDDISEDRWTRLDSDPTRFGTDGALVAVNHAYTDGMRMTPASHHIAVRVGNAVLVLVRDGEFGMTGVAETDARQRAVADQLIGQMCPFAGRTSACSA